jgi:hypothetical protein
VTCSSWLVRLCYVCSLCIAPYARYSALLVMWYCQNQMYLNGSVAFSKHSGCYQIWQRQHSLYASSWKLPS